MDKNTIESPHTYSGNLVLSISRTALAEGPRAMEDYMRALVVRFPELTDHCDMKVTIEPVACELDDCRVCAKVRGAKLIDELHIANLTTYLENEAESMASSFQRSRMQTCGGREVELLSIARTVLFRPFVALTRRPKRYADAVIHHASCHHPSLLWSVNNALMDSNIVPALLSPSECATLFQVKTAAMEAAKHEWLIRSGTTVVEITIVTHQALCETCGRAYQDHGALVTIPWAGRTLSREYLL